MPGSWRLRVRPGLKLDAWPCLHPREEPKNSIGLGSPAKRYEATSDLHNLYCPATRRTLSKRFLANLRSGFQN